MAAAISVSGASRRGEKKKKKKKKKLKRSAWRKIEKWRISEE